MLQQTVVQHYFNRLYRYSQIYFTLVELACGKMCFLIDVFKIMNEELI